MKKTFERANRFIEAGEHKKHEFRNRTKNGKFPP